jgi:hypothetical protein
VKICGVDEKSVCALKGITSGDELLKINGNEIMDVLDYDFYMTEQHLTLTFKCKDGKYLKWNASKRIFESKYYCFNAQSTYLYVLLNGFPLGETNNITWVDEEVWRPINLGITNKPRKNVFKYEFVDDKFIKMEPEQRCERMWSFTRKDEI